LNFLTKKIPYKGLGADSEEKHEPVGDIDTAAVDSLKTLDPKRPIREATEQRTQFYVGFVPTTGPRLYGPSLLGSYFPDGIAASVER
jgi:hypothetical protein